MKRGPYEITSTKEVYKNPWITVREDTIIHPSGDEGIYGVVDYISGVAVVALNEKQEIYLIKEYAYAIDQYSISLPSGGVDDGEVPLIAAKRELLEETGVTATQWTDLGYIDPYTMIINGPQHMFLAQGTSLGMKLEEDIKLITVPFSEAYQMVIDSKITHGASCVAILKARDFLLKNS